MVLRDSILKSGIEELDTVPRIKIRFAASKASALAPFQAPAPHFFNCVLQKFQALCSFTRSNHWSEENWET